MEEQYWVTELAIGRRSPNEQMRFLNELIDDPDHTYELIGCDTQGHYIFKLTKKEQS